jgi:C-terminal processing protease CtpA/Prc
MKPQMSKPHGGGNFKGKLIVLVDSKSGSAAEIFARVVQLEKRGVIIGDRTAGAVMQSRIFDHQAGTEIVVFYGVSVTNADVIMADGKSLEGVGVTPDELLLPTAADLAAKRDPVMARAAAMAGFELPPDKAGVMFPIEWRK